MFLSLNRSSLTNSLTSCICLAACTSCLTAYSRNYYEKYHLLLALPVSHVCQHFREMIFETSVSDLMST